MKVSVSGYYYWLKHPISTRTAKEQALLADIHKIYDDSKKRGPDAHARGRSIHHGGEVIPAPALNLKIREVIGSN